MAANGIVWSRGCIGGGAKVLACVTFEVSVLVTLLPLICHFSLGGTALWEIAVLSQ